MENLRNRRVAGPVSLLLTLVVALGAALIYGGASTQAAPAQTEASSRPVAHTGDGALSSRIVGTADGGRDVRGSFTPLSFNKRNGKVFARGLIEGVIKNDNGSTRTFAVMRSMRVKSINGTAIQGGSSSAQSAQRATCRILKLVLRPLDLDLLGLKVHLDTVKLNIDAESGPGNLLGNLLCDVTHLLDGGLNGLLGKLTRLLNKILGQLGLGL